MRKVYFFIFGCTVLSAPILAQDSLIYKGVAKTDNTYNFSDSKLDSLQQNFHNRTDSLQKAYAGPMNEIHSSMDKLKHKKDSLSHLPTPAKSVTHKIDSINGEINKLEKERTAKLKELNSKIDKVKSETLTKVSSLHLPPQAQNEINTLTKNIHSFKVPTDFFKLPGMNSIPKGINIPGVSNLSLSLPANLNIPSAKIPSLQKFNLSSPPALPSLKQLEGSLGKEINQLKSNASLQALEKNAVKELSQNAEVKSLLKEENQVKEMEGKLSQVKDAKGAKEMAEQQLQPAINHFAGKEKELQSAMTEVSKYKKKYSEVKSLAELPKRAPNPLKSKPWMERVVPGLNYFILTKHTTFVDFNPYVGWRFNPRLTVSIGWSERIGIVHGQASTSEHERVHGVRAGGSYNLGKGFLVRLAPEVMSAYIPINGTPDVPKQTLVFGFFGGIRKDFKIYKGLIGYTEAMYNFIQKPGQNIYGDPLSLRLGLEMTIKKKAKQNVGLVNPSTLKNKSVAPTDSFHIVKKEKFFGVVDIKGDTLVSAQYSKLKKFTSNGQLYFIVSRSKKYGAFDHRGKPVIPLSFPTGAQVRIEITSRWVNQEKQKADLSKIKIVE